MMQLYDWQREAIDELESGGGRVLVVAPTGGGKSLCFQQPAVDLDGVALVVTPLISLMADQVTSLEARGIPAAYLATSLSADENRHREEAALAGKLKLLYVAPERLASERFVEEVLMRLRLSLVAVDEAHCISHWGHDFRPDYLQLGDLVERLQPQRLIACTATATPAVRREIVERLGMPDARQVLRGFARRNLQLSVEEASGAKAKERRIAAALKQWLGAPGGGHGGAIVYTGSRRNAELVAVSMRGLGWRAAHYHAGMAGDERREAQALFQAGDVDVIAATNAFGMGIDRADIRLVVHHALPESVEAYYQEVGRAGRDGQPAAGLLLIADPDIALRFRLIALDEGLPPEQALHRRPAATTRSSTTSRTWRRSWAVAVTATTAAQRPRAASARSRMRPTRRMRCARR
jgi:ATP-dependent DNA helicase RecQ